MNKNFTYLGAALLGLATYATILPMTGCQALNPTTNPSTQPNQTAINAVQGAQDTLDLAEAVVAVEVIDGKISNAQNTQIQKDFTTAQASINIAMNLAEEGDPSYQNLVQAVISGLDVYTTTTDAQTVVSAKAQMTHHIVK